MREEATGGNSRQDEGKGKGIFLLLRPSLAFYCLLLHVLQSSAVASCCVLLPSPLPLPPHLGSFCLNIVLPPLTFSCLFLFTLFASWCRIWLMWPPLAYFPICSSSSPSSLSSSCLLLLLAASSCLLLHLLLLVGGALGVRVST